MRKSLRTRLTVYFIALVMVPLLLVGAIGTWQAYTTQSRQALDTQSQIAKRVAEQVETFIQQRESELRSLGNVSGLANATSEQQNFLLSNLFASQTVYQELTLVNSVGQELTYLSRSAVVSGSDLGSRKGADEYEQPKATDQTYFSPVSFDPDTGEPSMTIAVPLKDLRSGNLRYVLIAKFRFKPVWDLMAQADVIGGGIVYMTDSNYFVVAHPNPSIVLSKTQANLPAVNSFAPGLSGNDAAIARESIRFNQQTFNIVAEQPATEALALAINNTILTVSITLAALVVAGFLGVLAARQITNPIGELAETARIISEGDLTRAPRVTSRDEIGALAAAFNSMTIQLRELISSLEQRVAARTKDLAAVAEVGTATATVLETKSLLQAVADLSKERFNLYHSHIYLLDDAGETLVLASGAGEAGRKMVAKGHSIPLGREQSLVARAARERKGVTVNDVTQAPDFLPNPLLPDTRSELAVPMIVGDKLIGVFDVQSDQVGRFTESDISVQTALASQVAVALQNVRQFEQSQLSEARFRAVTETASDAIISADEHGNIIYLNPTAQDIFGFSEEEAIGQSLKIIMPLQFHHLHESGINRYLQTREPHVIDQTVELVGRHKDGREFPIELSLASWEAGENTFFTALIRDITERKKNEETLEQRARQQETLNLITQKIQSAATVESAMQVAARELGHALGQKPTMVTLAPASLADERKAITRE